MGEVRLAQGSPLWLELEVSLGNTCRRRQLSVRQLIRREAGAGSTIPKCRTFLPHLPVPLSLPGSLWVG